MIFGKKKKIAKMVRKSMVKSKKKIYNRVTYHIPYECPGSASISTNNPKVLDIADVDVELFVGRYVGW